MIKLIFLIMIFSFNLFAQDLIDCKEAYNSLGDGSGNDHIPAQCINEIKSKSDKSLVQEFKDDHVDYVFKAVSNAFIWEDRNTGSLFVTSGAATLLKDIRKILFDSNKNEIYVWDKSEESIYIFNALLPGNVPPIRIITIPEFSGMIDFELGNDVVYILLDNKDMISLSKEANTIQRDEKQKLDILSTIPQDINSNCLENNTGNIIAKRCNN